MSASSSIRSLLTGRVDPGHFSGTYISRTVGLLSPSPEDGNVVGAFIVDEPLDPPPRPVHDLGHVIRRREEVGEPGVYQVAVADADAELSGHPSSTTVVLLIGTVHGIVRSIQICAPRHDPVGQRAQRS